jgi:hypothetical protein
MPVPSSSVLSVDLQDRHGDAIEIAQLAGRVAAEGQHHKESRAGARNIGNFIQRKSIGPCVAKCDDATHRAAIPEEDFVHAVSRDRGE